MKIEEQIEEIRGMDRKALNARAEELGIETKGRIEALREQVELKLIEIATEPKPEETDPETAEEKPVVAAEDLAPLVDDNGNDLPVPDSTVAPADDPGSPLATEAPENINIAPVVVDPQDAPGVMSPYGTFNTSKVSDNPDGTETWQDNSFHTPRKFIKA